VSGPGAFIANPEPQAAFEGMLGLSAQGVGARAAGLYEVFQPPGQAPGGPAHASVGVLPAALSAWLAEVLRDGAALQQARSVSAEHAGGAGS
jgi:hypothetical protein